METQHQQPHAERQYLHTLVAGAWLPFVQSTLTALVIAIGTWVITYFVFDLRDPHKWAITIFVIVWIYMLVTLQRHWLNLTTVEEFFQQDINGDGVIGEATEQQSAKPRRVVIQLDTVKEDGHYQVGDSSALVNLPCSDDQLYTLAQGLSNGMSFSEKVWTGNGKPFSTADFRNLRAEMFKHNLIEYVNEKDKRQGIRLTSAGAAVMKECVTSPTPL